MRNSNQLASVGVGPRVIGAAEHAAVAEFILAHGSSAVATAVDQNGNLFIGHMGYDDRMPTNESRLVVPVFSYLTDVGEIHPGPMKNLLHLQVENFWIGVD